MVVVGGCVVVVGGAVVVVGGAVVVVGGCVVVVVTLPLQADSNNIATSIKIANEQNSILFIRLSP